MVWRNALVGESVRLTFRLPRPARLAFREPAKGHFPPVAYSGDGASSEDSRKRTADTPYLSPLCRSHYDAMDAVDLDGGTGCRVCWAGQWAVRLLRLRWRTIEFIVPQRRGLLLSVRLCRRDSEFRLFWLLRSESDLLRQRLGGLLLPPCEGAGVLDPRRHTQGEVLSVRSAGDGPRR
jgi:hypothetical protein